MTTTDRRPAPPTSILNAGFISLIVVNFFHQMGQQMASTCTPLFADSLGASSAVVGFIAGAFAVTALAVRPIAGPAFDSFSKKWLLFGSYAAIISAMVGYGFVTSVPGLIAMRLLHGVGAGFSGPLSLALASENLPPDKIGSGVSVFMLAQAVAQAIGPATGIELIGLIGFSHTFYLTAGAFVIAAVLVALLRERGPRVRKPYKIRLDRIVARQAIPSAIVLFMLQVPFTCTLAFMVLYGQARGVEQIGLYFTVYAVALLATRPLFGKLADRLGTVAVLVPAIACFAVSYVIVSQATTLPMFLVAAVVAACGYGVCNPLVQALMIECVPPDSVGAGSNTTYIGLDVGNIIGATVGGFAVDLLLVRTGSQAAAYSGMWLVMIVPIALSIVVLFSQRRRMARYIDEKKRAMADMRD